MGLENGISIKRTDKIAGISELGRFYYTGYDYEVVYWCQEYGIRIDIFDLGVGYTGERYSMSADDVEKVISLLENYDEHTWQENYMHSRDWEDIKDLIEEQIEDLRALQGLMDKYELEVYFYDSY